MWSTPVGANHNHVANHMAKARTPGYTCSLDLALCKESEGDVLSALLHGTLSKIEKIIDTGYIVLRTYYVRARVTIGRDSPWLRHLLGLSIYFSVGSVYSLATWCRDTKNGVTRTFHKGRNKNAIFVHSCCNCL